MPIVSAKYDDKIPPLFLASRRTGEPPAELLRWLNEKINGRWARVYGSPIEQKNVRKEVVDMLSGEELNYYRIHQNLVMKRDGIKKRDMPLLKYYEIVWFEKEQDAISFKLAWC